MEKQKTVSLVLGSGGARGLAHIGVIRCLEERGYKIKSISGCSIGALVGGIYAAGKLDDFENWAKAITKIDVVKLLDISWEVNGLLKGDKLIQTLTKLVGDIEIEDLPIKYTAVAADIINEKEVWLNSGKLFSAIRASISLPLFLTPYQYDGVELIDGGVLNPLPVAPTFNDSSDMTLAINLVGKVNFSQKIQKNNVSINKESAVFTKKITEFINSFTEPATKKLNAGRDVIDIANQSFDAMQSTISRQKLAAYPADYTVEIARNACGILDFDMAAEMIALGYEKTKECLDNIEQ